MDSKTIIALLRADAKYPAMLKGRSIPAISDMYTKIADFIEQQESDIAKLCKSLNYIKGIVERGENRTLSDKEWIDQAILNYVVKLEQQEKYAKLGRLAVEFLADKDYCSDNCAISAFKDGVNDNCKECWVFKICQKRAELLVGQVNE